MQLNSSTYPGLGVSDPLNPQQTIDAGVSLLARYNLQYGGDTTKILWAYAAGPGSVANGNMPAMVPGYVDWVNNWMSTNSPSFDSSVLAAPDGGGPDLSGSDLSTTVIVGGLLALGALILLMR